MHTASTPPYTHVNALSPNRILHVLAYSPADGELDAPITVRLHCQSDLASNIYIRLVVGQKPVHSRISAAPVPDAYGQWQLNAAAPRPPAFAPDANSLTVDLSVQALNEQGQVLDSVAFGHFTYWRTDSPSPRNRHLYVDDAKARRRRATSDVTRMPDGPRRPRTYTMPSQPQGVQLHRRQKAKSISRSRAAPTDDYVYEVPVLELVTPLEEICKGWDADELDQGRRLISVQRVFHGRKLIVTCSVLRQEDYRPSDDCVISCIYHEQSNTCFVTSVDIIYLLERLTQQDFPVEEKNRIRRNLEGLRPTTVSKHRAGYESFFQRIMDFPDPKPRNIEKDLKVFEFTLLGQALDKILSKYECRIPKESSGSGIPTLAPSFGRGGSPHSAPSEPRSSASPTMSAYHLPSYNPQLHIVTQPTHPMEGGIYQDGGHCPEEYSPTYSTHSASSYGPSPASYGQDMKYAQEMKYAQDVTYGQGMKQGRSSEESLLSAHSQGPVDHLHTFGYEVAEPAMHGADAGLQVAEPTMQYSHDPMYDFHPYPFHNAPEDSIGCLNTAPYVV